MYQTFSSFLMISFSDRLIASIVLSRLLGSFCCQLLNWKSARIAQDDIMYVLKLCFVPKML